MSDDAIVMLREDHRELRRALRAFERTDDTETAQRGEIVDRLVNLFDAHRHVETQVMYPRIRELVPELGHRVLEALERHDVTEGLTSQLSSREPYDERFAAKARVLGELVEHHIDQDEDELYPRIRAALGRKDLQRIGRELRKARDDKESSRNTSDPLAHVVHAVLH